MKFAIPFTILPFLAVVWAQDSSLRQVKQAFQAANIPRDLSITFNPTVFLDVSLPQPSGPVITLRAGTQLPRDATAGPPSFSLRGVSPRGPFVIAMVDPDAPTPAEPVYAQIRHFLGGNFVIDGRERFAGPHQLYNSSAAITEFRQSNPPAGSPAHRYVYLVFKQPPGFNEQVLVTPETSIGLFNISGFAEEAGLGKPIGGTYILVAPDS
ncbi:hypothetical protein ONZ45_g4626 [Pleurotus djamor]|nr:hypothetical protein ONZ45_g4626 [Pleurotus djamor]